MQISQGRVVWLTGLSGSGKSTLCQNVAGELQRRMIRVHVLDGDSIRRNLSADLGFGMEDRLTNVLRATFVAKTLAQHGVTVLVALIAPLISIRNAIRSEIPDLLEVYVSAPLETCERRDPKGLYKRARSGELTQFTGIDSPFEAPQNPVLVCHTDVESIAESTNRLLELIIGANSDFKECDPASNCRRQTIAVDFDGVAVNYDGWRGSGYFGSPRLDVKDALVRLRQEGWKIIIHTTRSPDEVREYLTEMNICYDEINTNLDYSNRGTKPVATIYWDDRAVKYSGNALDDLYLIRNFRTWNNRR